MHEPGGNPYSALERFGAAAALEPVRRKRPAPTRWPLWLDPVAWLAMALISAYRLLVPIAWRRRCIYSPTCSSYGLDAIRRYGGVRGAVHTLARIRRCNGALYLGGDDPA